MLSPVPLGWRHTPAPDVLSTGVLDCPRGRISEIFGPRSSGRTSLLHSILAASTSRGEHAALIDSASAFDPCSASAAGVEMGKLIWIRCNGNVEHAMRAADLVIHSGGFGVVAIDLAEAGESALGRIPPTAWFRFRRAVEATPTVLAVLAGRPLTKSCSALLVETKRVRFQFTGKLLRGAEYELAPRKPAGQAQIAFYRTAV
jgi:recA bacterial DNA recombination protein